MSKDQAEIPLWSPKTTGMTALERLLFRKGFNSYWDLHQWSIENPGEFWSEAWDDLGIVGEKRNRSYEANDDFISAKFFQDSYLNLAENLLSRGKDGEIAIISISETGARKELSWGDLRNKVAATSAFMSHHGVTQGDRVASWTPNIAETVIWCLAAQSLGAIVSTASCDFAPIAVQERFAQIEPKLLLVAESYVYGGKSFDLRDKIVEIQNLLPTVTTVVSAERFDELIGPFYGSNLVFQKFAFDNPGFILFSSGTTGKPKCIVHSGAGVLIKAGSEILYQFSITKGEKVLFYTTCGWMMWNWLVTNLLVGATIILYDGNPGFPYIDRLLEIAEQEKVNFLGASAKYYDSLRKANIRAIDSRDLSELRMLGSTGSVLSPDCFDYIYQSIKKDVHLASLSGGTDICGCFLASVPTLPVYRGELQAPCLGMAVEVFDENGFIAAPHHKGELVCTVPFPSKPIGFWNDANDEKYRASYFEGFPGVWTHGDFASKSQHGGFIIFGRSDATLNSKGVRIGTAEIYRIVEKLPEIQECMAVSQDWDDDSRIILFVVLKGGSQWSTELESLIRTSLRQQASPRHVPDKILVAPELPRTKSNKLVEIAVSDTINGREVRNQNALANPQALSWFVNLAELRN